MIGNLLRKGASILVVVFFIGLLLLPFLYVGAVGNWILIAIIILWRAWYYWATRNSKGGWEGGSTNTPANAKKAAAVGLGFLLLSGGRLIVFFVLGV